MISQKHKFLFIHIPRTGGTSIERELGYYENFHDKHWTLTDWQKELNNETIKEYFKFSFVRNPWDLIVSKYRADWYNSNRPGWGGRIGMQSGKSLKFFLSKYSPAKHENGDTFFDFFNSEEMDFIGRFENRKDDLEFISNKIGIKINSKKLFRMPSAKLEKHYTEYYNEQTREIIAEKYAREIEYFGYKFGA